MFGKIKYIPAYVAEQLVAENAAPVAGKAESTLCSEGSLCTARCAAVRTSQALAEEWPHCFPVCSAMGAASGDSLKAALSSNCRPSGSSSKPRHFAQFSNAEGKVIKLTYVVIFCL